MTSLDVAPATSTLHKPQPQRESLRKGDIIEFQIPADAKTCTLPDSSLTFLQFPLDVKGGKVNVFVHADEPSEWCGKRASFEVEVLRKTISNERQFVFVDLRPTDEKPNAELWVSWTKLKTKQQVLFRVDALLGEVSITKLAASTTGNKQLERYICEGWSIQHEDERAWYLTKTGKNMLTHPKPKKKK